MRPAKPDRMETWEKGPHPTPLPLKREREEEKILQSSRRGDIDRTPKRNVKPHV
jgi:hypothetical protein